MTADIIQIRDHQSKRQREQAEAALREMTLEQQATNTAPSEYSAPMDDPA